jgi:hypothetical protein
MRTRSTELCSPSKLKRMATTALNAFSLETTTSRLLCASSVAFFILSNDLSDSSGRRLHQTPLHLPRRSRQAPLHYYLQRYRLCFSSSCSSAAVYKLDPVADAKSLTLWSSHSLRVRACVILHAMGFTDVRIMWLLRWNSTAFLTYLRKTSRSPLQPPAPCLLRRRSYMHHVI